MQRKYFEAWRVTEIEAVLLLEMSSFLQIWAPSVLVTILEEASIISVLNRFFL